MLSPRWLVEREGHAGIVQGLADEIAALWWDVGVFLAEDLGGWKGEVSLGQDRDQQCQQDMVDVKKRTMISSPLISLTRLILSSFLPLPSVCEWMSVAK